MDAGNNPSTYRHTAHIEAIAAGEMRRNHGTLGASSGRLSHPTEGARVRVCVSMYVGVRERLFVTFHSLGGNLYMFDRVL